MAAANNQGWISHLVAEAIGKSRESIKHFLVTYPNWNLAI